MPNNFVYLPQAKTTLNLLHISAVQWYKVENPEVDSAVYVTTVATLGAGDFYITTSDTKCLMKALELSNLERQQPVQALHKISDALFWLCRFVSELNLAQSKPDNSAGITTVSATSKATDAIKDSPLSNPKAAVPAPAGSGSRRSQYSEINN